MTHNTKRIVGFLFVLIAVIGLAVTKPDRRVENSDGVTVVTTRRDGTQRSSSVTMIHVYVSGAVENPGVYTFSETVIMKDVVDMAGGFLDTADTESLNLAERLENHDMVEIPFREEDAADDVTIMVEVAGEVSRPGMYAMDEGSRVGDLLDEAGGLTADADAGAVNRAAFLVDGQKINVPAVPDEQVASITVDVRGAVIDPGIHEVPADATVLEVLTMVGLSENADPFGLDLTAPVGEDMLIEVPYVEDAEPELIDLNQADKEALMTLPGIGETIARRIISFRTSVRPFTAVEDIMLIDGIGFKTYEELKAYLTV